MMKSKGSSTTDATVPDVIRSSIWFQDGNIVLLGQKSVAFKVHRGQLERHSEIFRDLFSIPQPGNQVLLEGCCMVELHDDPSDVFCLLSALYDGLYFKKPYALCFSVLASVLRLSTKYFIEHLRQLCIKRLENDWPSTLSGWDSRESEATDEMGRYSPRESFPHPILVIYLALELDLHAILPAAFYDLSRYGPSKIMTGAIPSPTIPYCSNGEPVTPHQPAIRLAHYHLCNTLMGREQAQRYLATFIDRELTDRPVAAECQNKDTAMARYCTESFYFILLNLLRSVGGVACGRDGDPLFTLLQAMDMLSRTDFSDGEKQCGLKLCTPCKSDFATSVERGREEVWRLIPEWFNIPLRCVSKGVCDFPG